MELRVGILCNGTTFRAWEAEAIRKLMAVPGVRIVLLVKNRNNGPRSGTGLVQRVMRYPWRMFLYLQYRKRWFKPKAMQMEDLGPLFATVPVVEVDVQRKGFSERFTQHDLSIIAGHHPDVLLRFGFNIIRGEILQLPRYGVWSFHHGDETRYRGGPPVFWEIMHGDGVTGAILQRLTDKLDGGRVLYKGWFRTVDHSLVETVDTVLTNSAHWPAHVAKRILAGDAGAAEGVPSATDAPVFKYPGNLTFIRFLVHMARNKWRFHRGRTEMQEQWNIAVLHQPITSLLEEKPSLNARWLPEPAKGQFRADPFGYVRNGELNVLYEKFDYRTRQGFIARIRPKGDNVLKRSRTMLNEGRHLSYPFIVEHQGAVYCVPESIADGRVMLYKVNEANDALEPVAKLLDEPLVDPTLFRHDGRWWLFGTKAPLTNVELHAFWSDNLTGPFVAHALNPLKHDIRTARPGGTPFMRGTELWRPAQDSSRTYGGRIAFNRIDRLTPTDFAETTVKIMEPLRGTSFNKGLHTVSAVGDITLLDGKRYVPAVRAKGDRSDSEEDEADDE